MTMFCMFLVFDYRAFNMLNMFKKIIEHLFSF